MITAIEIENFKCIGERVRIELAPVTLLFGPNSAGKSTIIEALLYFFEILERNNVDAHETQKGGKTIDLGGFRNLVHLRDLSRSVKLKVEFEVDFLEPPPEVESFRYFYGMSENNIDDTKSAWVELEVHWNHLLEKPIIIRYEVGFDGRMAGAIIASEDGQRVEISRLNPRYWDLPTKIWFMISVDVLCTGEILVRQYIPEEKQGKFFGLLEALSPEAEILDEKIKRLLESPNEKEFLSQLTDFLDKFIQEARFNDSDFPDVWPLISPAFLVQNMTHFDTEGFDSGKIPVLRQNSALPSFDRALAIEGLDALEFFKVDLDTIEDCMTGSYLLNQIFVSPARHMRAQLRCLRFLGPVRDMPNRGFFPPSQPDDGRWAGGLGAWDTLFLTGNGLTDKVNQWLVRADRLATGFGLRRYRKIALDSVELSEATRRLRELGDHGEALERLILQAPGEIEVVLVDEKTGEYRKPHDVGTGISQILPVVVATLSEGEGLRCIEQPELHIHPRLQTSLGDLFISQIQQGEKQFLLETHSEHLLLRLLRRVRESAENELEPGLWPLRPDQLSVNYLEFGSDGMTIRQLEVNKDGDFDNDWPEGFFQERREELF